MAPLGPFGPAPRLAAGVSGGPHSLALALLADRWARRRGGDVLALVADHGLRPESAAEAAHVHGLLAGCGVAAQVVRLGLATGPSMQERARAARLAALALARRRRLGPFAAADEAVADPDERRKRREKQIAALIRAGHEFALARAVIDADSVASAEAWAEREED